MNRKVRLSEVDRERIRLAVERAEEKTSGEIVPVVLDSAASYERATWIWTALGGLLGAVLFVTWHEWRLYRNWNAEELLQSPVWALLSQIIGLFAGYFLSGFSGLKRRVLPRLHLARSVDARAKELFVEYGLTRTRDRTGVLLLVSRFERRVEILADEGIHRVVGEGYWKAQVDDLVQAIHQDRFIEGLERCIASIGARLAEKFPRAADDQNELSNEPREGV